MSSNNFGTDICNKDLMVMAFLKTKYWGLFRDIEQNRDLYTQLRLQDRRASLLFDDKDDQEYRKKHFNDLFERLGYKTKDSELLRTVLDETFPGWRGSESHEDEDSLRSDGRIGHRDLLDLYFSYGVSHQTFKKHMRQVTPLIEYISKGSEKELLYKFREFNRYALEQEQPGDIARLLARRLLKLNEDTGVPVTIWRCWLRALLRYELGAHEQTNSILASILSGANETIQRSIPANHSSSSDLAASIDYRVDLSQKFFMDITRYLNDPYLALLALLFVLPARGNGFFLDYINRHGFTDLYFPVLDYVSGYFITQKRNVFHEYEWPYWSFVLYQWSLSISQNSAINKSIPDAVDRHRKVNNYVFAILRLDSKLTYQFVKQQFWSDEGWASEPYKWRIESKIAQYNNLQDRNNILAVVAVALKSRELAEGQKEELREFSQLFDAFTAKMGDNKSNIQ